MSAQAAGSSSPVSAGVLGAVHAAARGVRTFTQECAPILAGKAMRTSSAGERPRSSGSASSGQKECPDAQRPALPSDKIHFGVPRGRPAGAVSPPAGAAKRTRHPETLWHETWMETAPPAFRLPQRRRRLARRAVPVGSGPGGIRISQGFAPTPTDTFSTRTPIRLAALAADGATSLSLRSPTQKQETGSCSPVPPTGYKPHGDKQ